jgi:sec-independent protein translocase protein TatA
MFEGLFQPMHIVLILAIAAVLFGPGKLPELGRGLGEAIRGFKEGLNQKTEPKPDEKSEHAAVDARRD